MGISMMDPLSRRDFDRKTTFSLKIALPSGNKLLARRNAVEGSDRERRTN
jgi:hypothetical protein